MVSKRSISELTETKLSDREEYRDSRKQEEEAILVLFEHRAIEVERIRKRISYYTDQLKVAEEKLRDAEVKLDEIRGKKRGVSAKSKAKVENEVKRCKVEVPSPENTDFDSSFRYPKLTPETTVPESKPVIVQPISFVPIKEIQVNVQEKILEPTSRVNEVIEVPSEDSDEDLISTICSSSTSNGILFHSNIYVPAQHKRKLKNLALCPVNEKDFVTSSLDGVVNLWKIQAKGANASMHTATECFSNTRRWPEDVAWHPSKHILFCTYYADSGDSQISVVDYSKTQAKNRVTFLSEKPHCKGAINCMSFMPWDNGGFVTGGSDHAAIMWHEKENGKSWKNSFLHRNNHSSAVMGVAGLVHKKVVLSAGSDRRTVGFDVEAGMTYFRIQLDSKCMSVLPNPRDFNLFMVQTGSPEKQLRLFDFRLRDRELLALGFKQESSESHSALISQSWSPNGWYLASGSVDPVIHIFDIRYNSGRPSQSIRAHHKRVFKAAWHRTLPHLISISSDGNIGIHNIV